MNENILETMQIASPCRADWNAMDGNDRLRFCAQCGLNVYNLAGMRRAEAEMLLRARGARLCVRFFRRADGTVLTQDCPVGLAAIRRRLRLWTLAAASLLGAFLAWFGMRQGYRVIPGTRVFMGDVVSAKPMIMGRIAAPAKPHKRDF